MTTSSPVERVLRLFTILLHLVHRPPPLRLGRRELAERCDCSPKTIGRDIALLQAATIPIDYDTSQHTYLLAEKGWSLTAAALPRQDAQALALALSLLAADGSGVPLAAQIKHAIDTLTIGLPPSQRQQMQELIARIHVSGGSARDYSKAPLPLLLQAAERQETVETLYDSLHSGRCEYRRMDPYRVDHREGRYWDVQAWCHRDERVKTFALDRVLEARLTGQTFEKRPWEESDAGVFGGLRDGSWVEVVARFDGVIARWARDRLWPFAAEFEEEPDGSLVMRGRVRGTEGIVRELLSWRRHVVVLGGPELRLRMAEEIEAMAQVYSEPKKK